MKRASILLLLSSLLILVPLTTNARQLSIADATDVPTVATAAADAQATTLIPSQEVEIVKPDGWVVLEKNGSNALGNDSTIKFNNQNDNSMATRLTASQSLITFTHLITYVANTPHQVIDLVEQAGYWKSYRLGDTQTVAVNGTAVTMVEYSLGTQQVGAILVTASPYSIFHIAIIRSGSPAQYAKDKQAALQIAASTQVANTAHFAQTLGLPTVQPDPSLLTQDVDTGPLFPATEEGPLQFRLPADFQRLAQNARSIESGYTGLPDTTGFAGNSSYSTDTLTVYVVPASWPGETEHEELKSQVDLLEGDPGPYKIGPYQAFNLNQRAITTVEGAAQAASLLGLSIRTENGDLVTIMAFLSGSGTAKPFTDNERKIIYSIAASITSTHKFDTYSTVQAVPTPPPLPNAQTMNYGQTANVTIPGSGRAYVIFSGKKGQVVFVQARVDDNKNILIEMDQRNGAFVSSSGPYGPFERTSASLPADGDYYLQLTNFNSDSVTIQVALTQLTPDNGKTTDGKLELGKSVSAYINASETDSWVFSAKAGQTYTIEFDGEDEVDIRTKGGDLLAITNGYDYASKPYQLDIKSDQTVEITIQGSSPEVYTLKVSLGGQAVVTTATASQVPDQQGSGSNVTIVPTDTPIGLDTNTATPDSGSNPVDQPTEGPTATLIEMNIITATPPDGSNSISVAGQCPDSPPARLQIGGQGRVLPGDPNLLNTAPMRPTKHPGLSKSIARIPAGGVFTVLDGPQCADGITWWKVSYQGYTGWTGEGDTSYWVEPVN